MPREDLVTLNTPARSIEIPSESHALLERGTNFSRYVDRRKRSRESDAASKVDRPTRDTSEFFLRPAGARIS